MPFKDIAFKGIQSRRVTSGFSFLPATQIGDGIAVLAKGHPREARPLSSNGPACISFRPCEPIPTICQRTV
jgi:hypothetical protein